MGENGVRLVTGPSDETDRIREERGMSGGFVDYNSVSARGQEKKEEGEKNWEDHCDFSGGIDEERV